MSVNEFLDVLLGDPAAAPSLVWLPLIHRIAAAENGNVEERRVRCPKKTRLYFLF